MTFQIENNKKNLNKFESAPLNTNYTFFSGRSLIFSFNKAFIKKFSGLARENYEFPIFVQQDTDLLIKNIYLLKYDVIFLDVDSISSQLNKILNHIRIISNIKITKLYLITANKTIAAEIKQLRLHKKIITLFIKENEIVYFLGGRKYIY